MQKMMKKVWQRRRGFTLIELLIVVAIIGILAGIAIPNFMGARTKAKVSRAFADMRSIGNALEMYYIDNGSYPASSSDLTSPNRTYITSIPKDPCNSNGSRDSSEGAIADKSYGYCSSATAWLLISNGPDSTPDVTSVSDWNKKVSGLLGGPDGVYSGFGLNNDTTIHWYNPSNGTTSTGDLGVGGP